MQPPRANHRVRTEECPRTQVRRRHPPRLHRNKNEGPARAGTSRPVQRCRPAKKHVCRRRLADTKLTNGCGCPNVCLAPIRTPPLVTRLRRSPPSKAACATSRDQWCPPKGAHAHSARTLQTCLRADALRARCSTTNARFDVFPRRLFIADAAENSRTRLGSAFNDAGSVCPSGPRSRQSCPTSSRESLALHWSYNRCANREPRPCSRCQQPARAKVPARSRASRVASWTGNKGVHPRCWDRGKQVEHLEHVRDLQEQSAKAASTARSIACTTRRQQSQITRPRCPARHWTSLRRRPPIAVPAPPPCGLTSAQPTPARTRAP